MNESLRHQVQSAVFLYLADRYLNSKLFYPAYAPFLHKVLIFLLVTMACYALYLISLALIPVLGCKVLKILKVYLKIYSKKISGIKEL